MQIFFTTTLNSAIEHKESIETIVKHLSTKHKVVLRSKNINNLPEIVQTELPGVENRGNLSLQQIYIENQKKILTSDVVICEMSNTSTGIGYDVAQASLANKPILVLCHDNSKLTTESIVGNQSKRLVVKRYNENNLTDILDEFIQSASKMLDSKFILIIPPEIEQYLSWASHKKGVRKAELVRAAIDKYMDLDQDYKKYQTELNK